MFARAEQSSQIRVREELVPGEQKDPSEVLIILLDWFERSLGNIQNQTVVGRDQVVNNGMDAMFELQQLFNEMQPIISDKVSIIFNILIF